MKAFAGTPERTEGRWCSRWPAGPKKDKKIDGDWAGEASEIYETSVLPALKRRRSRCWKAAASARRPRTTPASGALKDSGDDRRCR